MATRALASASGTTRGPRPGGPHEQPEALGVRRARRVLAALALRGDAHGGRRHPMRRGRGGHRGLERVGSLGARRAPRAHRLGRRRRASGAASPRVAAGARGGRRRTSSTRSLGARAVSLAVGATATEASAVCAVGGCLAGIWRRLMGVEGSGVRGAAITMGRGAVVTETMFSWPGVGRLAVGKPD